MIHDDCGFRDDREVDRYYGRCPDCGDVLVNGRCHCDLPPDQEPDPTEFPDDPDMGDEEDHGFCLGCDLPRDMCECENEIPF